MHDVLIIADPVTARAYELSDFTVRPAEDTHTVLDFLEEAVHGKFRIVLITENLAESVRQDLDRFSRNNDTIITPIPGVGTSLHLGERLLAELRKTVVGI